MKCLTCFVFTPLLIAAVLSCTVTQFHLLHSPPPFFYLLGVYLFEIRVHLCAAMQNKFRPKLYSVTHEVIEV